MRKPTEGKSQNQVKEQINRVSVPEMLRDSFMPYAMSVIVSRALPEIDGLKPSHRKILYTMYDMGLLNGPRTKSANIAARTMLLNPHGDQSNYEAMVRLTQHNETLLTPVVDGKGSFGKHYSRDMSYAASRYTEARLMPVAHEFFDSIRKNTVDFVDNYDSTRKEPTLLPVTFPNILANPTEGIAVGLASSIPSFNLGELCDATILRIRNPRADIRTVMPGPDFTTGALMLMDDAAMDKVYQTGRGQVRLRAKYQVDRKSRIIEVTEIPFSTTAEAIIEGVVSLIRSGKLRDVSDIRNEIDLSGFKIAIDYKRGVDPDALMAKLFRLTKLEDSYTCNMTVLIDGSPKEIGVVEILDEWIKWRRGCVKRELTYDLGRKQHDLHILEGLAKMLADIDKAIRIIRKTEDDAQVIPNLMKGFGIDEEQALYIAEIKLRNLNRDYILTRTAAIGKLQGEIKTLEKQLGSDREIDKLIAETLKNVKKKYGMPRKTEIVYAQASVAEKEKVESVPNYPVRVYVTQEGYIKKIPASSLKADTEIRTKENDVIVRVIDMQNADEILFFTDRCNAYKVYTHTLKDCKPSDFGDYISNIVDMEEGESVVCVCPLDLSKHILIGFENGKAARIPLAAYQTRTNRKKLVGAYSGQSRLLAMYPAGDDDLFGFERSDGKLLVFRAGDVSEKSTRNTLGVQVLRNTAKTTATAMKPAEEYPKALRTPKPIPGAGVAVETGK